MHARANAIDPAKAQRLIHGLRPSQGLLVDMRLDETDDKLPRVRAALLQPRAQCDASVKKVGGFDTGSDAFEELSSALWEAAGRR